MKKLLKFNYIIIGVVLGLICLDLTAIHILKKANMFMHIEYVSSYDSYSGTDSFLDSIKLPQIVPEQILVQAPSFEEDIKKTTNYVATIVGGRYKSNPSPTPYQKLCSIIYQNGGYVET